MLEMARIVFIKQAAASQGAEKVVAESKVARSLKLMDLKDVQCLLARPVVINVLSRYALPCWP